MRLAAWNPRWVSWWLARGGTCVTAAVGGGLTNVKCYMLAEHKLDRHSQPDSDRLITAPRRLKAPLLDGLQGGLIEVRMAGSLLNPNFPHSAVREDFKE
jgi:hypothetical protein